MHLRNRSAWPPCRAYSHAGGVLVRVEPAPGGGRCAWLMESFFSTLQRELLDTRRWTSRAKLGSAIFEWIECWYNPHRRHTSLGLLSPIDYEHQLPALPTIADPAA